MINNQLSDEKMLKQFLEGFAIGLIFKAFGKTIILWFLVFLVLFMVGMTVIAMDENGSDLSLLYTFFGYIGKAIMFMVTFEIARFLVRNWKHLTAFLLLIASVSYLPVLMGHGGFQKATSTVLVFVILFAFVWVIDKLILNFQDKYKAIKAE